MLDLKETDPISQDLKRNTEETHEDFALLSDAIPSMQKVADHVNNYISKAKNKQKMMDISSGGAGSLLRAHRNLIVDCEVKCENRKRATAFFVFNDILVHLSVTKAKHKPNLTLPQAQWPLRLIWLQYPSIDVIKVVGPTDFYLLRTQAEGASVLINALKAAIEDDLRAQAVKLDISPSTLDSQERTGSFQFPNSVFYEGNWKNGKVTRIMYQR